jgi:hypothetical protein
VTISAFNYNNTAMSNGTNISKSNATKALDASNLTKINTSQIK